MADNDDISQSYAPPEDYVRSNDNVDSEDEMFEAITDMRAPDATTCQHTEVVAPPQLQLLQLLLLLLL
jgi:hypothetical protein